MRKQIVAGNWKMNTLLEEALNLIVAINQKITSEKEAIVCVPFTHIKSIQEVAKATIKVAAQNISQYDKGAYTGEISGAMLQSFGVKYVLVGHSERRQFFQENNVVLKEKINQALQYDIAPIFCCGESLEKRENGDFLAFIEQQLEESIFHLEETDFQKLIVAYEPIWAIGTGKTASAQEAQEVHAFIRLKIAQRYNQAIADKITILYGGSVKPANAAELFACADIDGGLVGGASLDADSFISIINAQ